MSIKTALASVGAAWQHFVSTGQFDETVLRPEVAQSWTRCRGLGMDPRAPKLQVKLSPRQLEAVREENQTFTETALPFMEFLRTAVKDTGFILVLTERSGIVLEVFGDDEILNMARENNYVPGCSRAEEVAGTNAISLALIEKRPIQLTGAEHWNARHHRWTCASAPVFSPEGMLLGTVTLSGETTNAHRHTLGMVISAAEAIRERLRERETALQKRDINVTLSSVLRSISESIITVDAGGLVTNINPAACKTLGANPAAVRGRSIADLFPGYPELAEVASLGRDSISVEVASDKVGGRGHYVITPFVTQSEGMPTGAIMALRERREFLNDVREFSCFNAVFTFEDIIGQSPELLRQIDMARVAARQNVRILILGETGTGKELFAQSIHNSSQRRRGPFVALNCAAIPRELMEAEFFGYKGGAFTGARKSGQIGKLELADGGTVFLDEIHQMPLDLQSKLLRALQDGAITRLGDTKPIRIDVRVIAAANEDLYAKSRAGEFREDLYYRLSVVELNLPPLRERTDDIPRLADSLLRKLGEKLDKTGLSLSPAAEDLLCRYTWPGNVRELENVLEMGAIMSASMVIEPADIAYRMRVKGPDAAPKKVVEAPSRSHSVRDVELNLIRGAIKEFNGNVAEAARKLGLSRSTVYRRMQQHGIIKSVTVD